jgi:hypothetical protein
MHIWVSSMLIGLQSPQLSIFFHAPMLIIDMMGALNESAAADAATLEEAPAEKAEAMAELLLDEAGAAVNVSLQLNVYISPTAFVRGICGRTKGAGVPAPSRDRPVCGWRWVAGGSES